MAAYTFILNWVRTFAGRGCEGVPPETARLIRRGRSFGLVAICLNFPAGVVASLLRDSILGVVASFIVLVCFALMLRVMRARQGRYAAATCHAGMGAMLLATTVVIMHIGGAPSGSVGYPSLVILAAAHTLGVRGAALWTLASVASLGIVVFSADLPLPASGGPPPTHVAIFFARTITLMSVFALAAMGRRLEDKQTEQLTFMARHDPLTGLLNRRELDEQVEVALARCRRYGRSLALIFVDLDGFKRVNDRLGHAAGDALLVSVGGEITRMTRATDVAARIGGDEFLVLLEAPADAKSAELYAERLLARIAVCAPDGVDATVSASVGIAFHPEDASDAPELTRCADVAMYAAKRAGGGRVLRYADTPPEALASA